MKSVLYLFCLITSAMPLAHAQSFCASDDQRAPVALVERFISADCEACWSDVRTPKMTAGQLAIDWIVPSSRGDDAVLSPAASRDALLRLEVLSRSACAWWAGCRTHWDGCWRQPSRAAKRPNKIDGNG